MRLTITIILLLLASSPVLAQQDSASHKLLGVGFGASLAKTDLSEGYEKPSQTFNLFLQFDKKQKKLTGAIHLNIGKIVSENPEGKFIDRSEFDINSFALTNFQSLHFEAIYHIVRKENWSISLAQGFGFMRFNVYDQENNPLVDQLDSRAPGESYTGFSVMLPTSISAHYLFENNFGLKARLGLMNTLNDYLDNVSTFGNPENNDNILSIQLALIKRFSSIKLFN